MTLQQQGVLSEILFLAGFLTLLSYQYLPTPEWLAFPAILVLVAGALLHLWVVRVKKVRPVPRRKRTP